MAVSDDPAASSAALFLRKGFHELIIRLDWSMASFLWAIAMVNPRLLLPAADMDENEAAAENAET